MAGIVATTVIALYLCYKENAALAGFRPFFIFFCFVLSSSIGFAFASTPMFQDVADLEFLLASGLGLC